MSTIKKSLITDLEDFLIRYYEEDVMELAKNYPQKKSIEIEFSDLEVFNPDLSEKLLHEPDETIGAFEAALRNIDLPVDKDLENSHVRFVELPNSEKVLARNIRSHHIGKFISMEGIIRKATEVRPRLINAHFECVRCGTEQKVKQDGTEFKEPYECKGCERKGPFDLDEDKSGFIDSQKLQIQEVPEKLRGGEQPQDINVKVEDEITGTGVPGNRVIINGVLRSYQKTNTKGKTNLFDVFIDCNSIEIKEQEFSEIEISEKEKEKIIELSEDPDIYQKIKDSIAPTIYGYDKVKEAMALQLFSGVPKELPDGSRIRGDIHTLLVGDPGIGKCVKGDTEVLTRDGSFKNIESIVESNLSSTPKRMEDGYYQETSFKIPSFDKNWNSELKTVSKVIKREAPDLMYKIRTKRGNKIELTPEHSLFKVNNSIRMVKPDKLSNGDYLLVPGEMKIDPSQVVSLNEKSAFDYENQNLIKSKVTGNDVLIDEVVEVEEKEPGYDWVYDLEVRDSHVYVTNKIVSHNSQILRYVANLAPRGVYASGKSSTSAGLCVAPDTEINTNREKFEIHELVEEFLDNPKEVRPGCFKEDIDSDLELFSIKDGSLVRCGLESVWKIRAPREMVYIEAVEGRGVEVTPETALPTQGEDKVLWKDAADIKEGEKIVSLDEEEVRWEEVTKKTRFTPNYDFVYDVTVDEHNFLANKLFVHNTAAAVRDEFGDGKWTLEAGALVLADKGVATIDEIDKMDSKDRSALHEAMEQQSISIAKAGITATLQSRCALLGAANPKYGRFDEYEPIAEQIDLEPTLLSRFDLIFTIQDEPDEEMDSKVASHIMTSHETGERSKNQGIDSEASSSEDIEPEIEPDMMRKYIAFSKKETPVLKPESKESLRDFYLDLRKAGEQEESPVPVTARQLEALIRLAEASARTRLSDEITQKDANRAINIVKSCLEEVGVDPETGELDIDVLTTGTSKSQRDKIRVVKEIIDEFDEGGDGADKDNVIIEAEERGIDESSAREIIRKLRENGDIIEPITNRTLRTT